MTAQPERAAVGQDKVADARRALGRVGVFLPATLSGAATVRVQLDAVRRLEQVGYRATWTNEVIGKDALVQLAVLLAATEQMVFGTAIANIWARPAQTMHAAATQLAEAYPGRLVLGLGVGYAQQAESVRADFGRPLSTMRDYLQRMPTTTGPEAPGSYLRLLGANGPKMLALAGDLTDGAIPAMVPPGDTARARDVLGADRLLVVLLGASGPQNDPATVPTQVRAHLTAGADHVVVGLPAGDDATAGLEQLEHLAPALLDLT